MAELLVIPPSGEGFLELARTGQGRLLRKHILNLGPLHYHGKTISLDEQFWQRLKSNFDRKLVPYVQVPLADRDNKHTEAPERNTGQVVGLERDGNKVYAVIDARKHAEDFGRTLLDASPMMHMDYLDTATGQRAGPALIHVAVTNRAHQLGLEPFEEIAASSPGFSWDEDTVALADAQRDEDTVALADGRAPGEWTPGEVSDELARLSAVHWREFGRMAPR